MKLVLISDTHGLESKLDLPAGDVLIHAGDLTNRGSVAELSRAAQWLSNQIENGKFHHVVCIAGNHDFALEHFMREGEEGMMRREIFQRIIYLRDSGVTLDGVKFYGSPWQPEFCDWAFNLKRRLPIREKWALIPEDTDVLVTHGPPMGIQDWVGRERVGCADLRVAVERLQPTLHTFGHIHGGYGENTAGPIHFVNASVVDENYKIVNAPIVVEVGLGLATPRASGSTPGILVSSIIEVERDRSYAD
jgi:Icc-related predicted phosphoesterase